MQEKHLDNIRKYQSLKRNLISVAQARKNMIVYLKNMPGRLRKVGTSQRVESSTESVVDIDTEVNLDAEFQGRIERKDDDNVVDKEVNAAEPTVFNDEEVTMTMAQTLIKMKAEKARLLDEKMAKRLHDEEVEQVVARKSKNKMT
nr:hypothetical protein [Tanacetum cinerariifolium]